ncbi:MAG: hypothetical protein ACLSHJ_04850 [Oscillospiraceae bacterium]
MKKKALALVLALAMSMALIACGQKDTPATTPMTVSPARPTSRRNPSTSSFPGTPAAATTLRPVSFSRSSRICSAWIS